MKTDAQIQQDVLDELTWDPRVAHEHIGVSVDDGIVTLSGHVPTHGEKSAAEVAVQRVAGVKAVVEKITVKYPDMDYRDDEDIANAILTVFKWNTQVPHDGVKVQVSGGWVQLKGEVEWEFQKTAAENAVKSLAGVIGVKNLIEIRPRVEPRDIKSKIEQALRRAADREVKGINIDVEGSKVILSGKVHSWAELRDIRGIIWNAPGVKAVEERVIISS